MNNSDNGSDELSYNSDGKVVFTAAYLLSRGYCCGNGCRNCPYEYKMVPEPLRSRLLGIRRQRKDQQHGTDE